MTDVEFTDAVHDLVCHDNHIDMCSYEYESWDEPRRTRNLWLAKARHVRNCCNATPEQILALLKAVRYL